MVGFALARPPVSDNRGEGRSGRGWGARGPRSRLDRLREGYPLRQPGKHRTTTTQLDTPTIAADRPALPTPRPRTSARGLDGQAALLVPRTASPLGCWPACRWSPGQHAIVPDSVRIPTRLRGTADRSELQSTGRNCRDRDHSPSAKPSPGRSVRGLPNLTAGRPFSLGDPAQISGRRLGFLGASVGRRREGKMPTPTVRRRGAGVKPPLNQDVIWINDRRYSDRDGTWSSRHLLLNRELTGMYACTMEERCRMCRGSRPGRRVPAITSAARALHPVLGRATDALRQGRNFFQQPIDRGRQAVFSVLS